jgi:hypothetical protein
MAGKQDIAEDKEEAQEIADEATGVTEKEEKKA